VLDYYVAAPLGKTHVLDEYLRRLTLQDYKPRKILFALEDYAMEPEVPEKTRCAGEFLLDSYNVVKLDISQLGEG